MMFIRTHHNELNPSGLAIEAVPLFSYIRG
jgi:hypothetical protein